MLTAIIGALTIAAMRICDVSLTTIRTILVVQGKKYIAGIVGFFEVLIWIFAIRTVMQHLDVIINLFGYATGFALGNIIGISLEQKIGFGYIQIMIISKHATDKIADALRNAHYGVTILPAEGSTGGTSIIMTIVSRKLQKKSLELIESIDKTAFITVTQSLPFRGYFHNRR